jgi:hypothetical protein
MNYEATIGELQLEFNKCLSGNLYKYEVQEEKAEE